MRTIDGGLVTASTTALPGAVGLRLTKGERYSALARWAAANGFYRTARKHSWHAFRCQPWSKRNVRLLALASLGRSSRTIARVVRGIVMVGARRRRDSLIKQNSRSVTLNEYLRSHFEISLTGRLR